MKALLLNALLGVGLGRFGTIWMAVAFVPIVAAEVAYGIYVFHLSTGACVRRTVTLFVCAQLAFMLGALLQARRKPYYAGNQYKIMAKPQFYLFQ